MIGQMEKELKQCEICGKMEMMTARSHWCKDCREQSKKEYKREYYAKNRERLLFINKTKSKIRYANTHPDVKSYVCERPKRYPVEYLNKNGQFTWQVRFYSPKTERYVVWASADSFESLAKAQKDFYKACGSGK